MKKAAGWITQLHSRYEPQPPSTALQYSAAFLSGDIVTLGLDKLHKAGPLRGIRLFEHATAVHRDNRSLLHMLSFKTQASTHPRLSSLGTELTSP